MLYRDVVVADEGGISRTALTRWYKRWLAFGDAGLEDRTSRPEHSPNATTDYAYTSQCRTIPTLPEA